MSDVYSTTDAPPHPVDPTPDDAGGKVSKQEANYRDGNLMYHCGLCQNFEGAVNGTCTRVEGDINPYMLSDEYEGVQNPLLHKTPPRFRPRPGGFVPSTGRAPVADAGESADVGDAEPDQPILRIGRKAY
jgi:hypothetical protein